MAEYIYARVSGDSQTTDPQLHTLKKRFPRASVVTETASGAKARPMLKTLIEQLEEGDTLIVYALDRLGRRAVEVLSMIDELEQAGVNLISVREGVDYSTPIGKLVTQILVSVAEMERNLIVERTKAGLAAARSKGRIGGRPRTISDRTIERGIRLVKEEGYTIRKAAAEVGVSYPYLSMALRSAPS